MLNRICVAYDDGAPAGAALAVAVRFAQRADAGLTLVHVAEPAIEEPVSAGDRIGFDLLGFTDERRWQARLTAVASDVGAELSPGHAFAIDARTVAGDVALELPGLVDATGAALIAAGAPRTGLRALLHRSVSRHLVKEATRPVLLARSGELRVDGAVLVCERGSSWADRRATTAGQRLATALGAPLVCRTVPDNADAGGYFVERCRREQPLAAVIAEEQEPGWRSRRHHPERVLPRRASCPVIVVGSGAGGPLVDGDGVLARPVAEPEPAVAGEAAQPDLPTYRPAGGASWEAC